MANPTLEDTADLEFRTLGAEEIGARLGQLARRVIEVSFKELYRCARAMKREEPGSVE